ncbi:unnamed protein product [Rhizophagus irregularis]|nr:unnamed protein product [Rhizophagus irregularis]
MGFQSIETSNIRKFSHSGGLLKYGKTKFHKFSRSDGLPKYRNPKDSFGRSGGLPKIGCSEERENSKIRSGGLPCSEEQENSKDSCGFDFGLWAFDSIGCDILGLWICIGCDISLAGFGSVSTLNFY